MARDHAARSGIDLGRIQLVRHLADQAQRRAAGHARVGIERDDIAHIPGEPRERVVEIQEARVARAAQQPVEFVKLAALALPPHPLALEGVPLAAAVQKKEERPFACMARVQRSDARAREVEQGLVRGRGFVVAVEPVRQHHENEARVGIGEVMHFHALDLLGDLVLVREQDRHHEDRAQLVRNALLERHRGQAFGAQPSRRRAVDERDGQFGRGDDAQDRKDDEPVPERNMGFLAEHHEAEDRGREQHDRADIAGQARRRRRRGCSAAGAMA